KRLATGLLVLVAGAYVAASFLEPRHPWLWYVARTCEAAMVGAIADWFAVVALFRHPLGLRFIPHTAILPRNKQRIAQGLSEFIQQNFLSTEAVVARIAAFQPARTLSGWLLRPGNAAVLAAYAGRFLAYGLQALDDERVKAFIGRQVDEALRRLDTAAAAAQVLDVLTENGRHHALFDEALGGLDDLLQREDTRRFIAEEVARAAPRYLKSINDVLNLKLDERAALRIVEVALRKVSEVRRDRDHELRRRFDAFVAAFVARLRTDPALRAKADALRDELLASPALSRYLGSVWGALRAWLAADLAREPSAVRSRLAAMAHGLGAKLEADAAIRQWIDEQILAAVPALVAEHRAKFGRFVEDQINAWEEEKLVDELERHIGPDLQFIRINGTVVGGLVGLLLAALTGWLKAS
ncbi:MAG TPA: DUF445 domain-containing protein, partial [Burkholderiales bacterium]|nr:DUF445 domain-containing protein [Burkholderiales bacterium]